MKSMHSETDRRAIMERVRRLTPDARPQWGKMNAPQMVVHLTDAIRMATGELPVPARKTPFRFPPLKQLFLYVLPMPKGLPTSSELIARAPTAWNGEMEALTDQLEAFAKRDTRQAWPNHPVFGSMSRDSWGVLAYKHCDHHLRQFGV